eukprot:CAMPEP_0171142336 /NCGR_PEP_ID=MMETSP0766_2-20121228/142242_1 /TAXON_ID=439317 /ORGANISM="Gambierdiscus australes, Strain CAWD 149" /LENGTH=143 /DNA_ID=CAMNT_0011606117 /DNA_START=687 /DNA_END=1119 /DNA_ORIENTATION=-
MSMAMPRERAPELVMAQPPQPRVMAPTVVLAPGRAPKSGMVEALALAPGPRRCLHTQTLGEEVNTARALAHNHLTSVHTGFWPSKVPMIRTPLEAEATARTPLIVHAFGVARPERRPVESSADIFGSCHIEKGPIRFFCGGVA